MPTSARSCGSLSRKLKKKGEISMKRNHILALLLALSVLLTLVGCAAKPAPAVQEPPAQAAPASQPEQAPAESEKPAEPEKAPAVPAIEPVTFTDMMGREVTLDKPATRIVALTAADCEILCALGGAAYLVGRGEYCDRPAEILDVPSVQSAYETNIEQIIALQPDVLLTGTMNQPKEQLDALEQAGIHVVESEANTIAGVYQAITMIGTLLGKLDEADAIVTEMKAGFAALSEKAGDGTKTVYFEVSPLEYGLWTAGKNTFMDEIASMLGLKNCFDDVSGWAEISEEQVLERNPDYIVTISMYFGEGPTPVEEIMGREAWQNVSAVANGNILNLDDDSLSRPCPRLLDGARALAELVGN